MAVLWWEREVVLWNHLLSFDMNLKWSYEACIVLWWETRGDLIKHLLSFDEKHEVTLWHHLLSFDENTRWFHGTIYCPLMRTWGGPMEPFIHNKCIKWKKMPFVLLSIRDGLTEQFGCPLMRTRDDLIEPFSLLRWPTIAADTSQCLLPWTRGHFPVSLEVWTRPLLRNRLDCSTGRLFCCQHEDLLWNHLACSTGLPCVWTQRHFHGASNSLPLFSIECEHKMSLTKLFCLFHWSFFDVNTKLFQQINLVCFTGRSLMWTSSRLNRSI